MNNPPQKIVLALTGASGIPYARRLLEILLHNSEATIWLMYSKAAQTVALQESQWILPNKAQEAHTNLIQEFSVCAERLQVYSREDWFAPCASGSNPPDAMIICPASMNTVALIAQGIAGSLIERTASVCLKERKKTIIVPRETPLSSIHLRNLLTLSDNGAHIIPPMPAFYHHPQKIDDLIDFIVARILDSIGIIHHLHHRWGEEKEKA